MARFRFWFPVFLIAVASLRAQPVIGPPFAVNAASYSFGLANSAIAQGSLFTVFGKNLGPPTLVSAPGFPLSTNLSGTSAQVNVNGVTVSPLMIFTVANQVGMLMPSSAPPGSGSITITYNGQTSSPVAIQITDAAFGIFTWNQAGTGTAVITDGSYSLISLLHPASPGQELVIWGVGLGKIAADETVPPPQGNVGPKPAVWVGSQQANVLYWGRSGAYAGLDQINFQVPGGQTGCYVPVAVQTGNIVSNFGSIAIAAGGACSDPGRLSAAQLALAQNGQNLNVATLTLSRSVVSTAGTGSSPAATTTTTDSGAASFLRYTPTQLAASSFNEAVSIGGCMVFPINGSASFADPVHPLGLDAGTVEIGGTNGAVILQPLPSDKGYYGETFGGSPGGALFLDVVGHTFNVFGGADVGVFSQELRMPSLTWTNQSSISSISESQGVTVAWSNAAANSTIRISGYSLSVDQSGQFGPGASFSCAARSGSNGSGQFTVPPAVLANLPLSPSSSSAPAGFLSVGASAAPSDPFTGARGVDAALATAALQLTKSVTYGK